MGIVLPPNKLGTGPSVLSPTVKYTFNAPADTWIFIFLQGMIWDYSQETSWTPDYALTPAECAQLFRQIWESLTVATPSIGYIIQFPGPTLPSNLLACDGSNYAVSAYPDLYTVIGNTYGGTPGTDFNVPKLNGRTPIGTGLADSGSTYTLAQEGGEESHVQTLSELATHSHVDAGHVHSVSDAGPNLTAIGVGVPDPTAIPVPAVTGVGNASIQSSGSSSPANVMQPWIALNYAIVAR